MPRLSLLAIAVSLAITACSSTPAAPLCAPGKQTSCSCADGARGEQVCKADGSGFDACVCDAGSGGAGGMGGASSSSSASAGGAGGGGGSGGAPECPAPVCPQVGDIYFNFDPACGAVDAQAANVCGTSTAALSEGVTIVRVPPTKGLAAGCMGQCGGSDTAWSFVFQLPGGACVQILGPEKYIADVVQGSNVSICDDNSTTCGHGTSGTNGYLVLGLLASHPSDNGATFKVTVTTGAQSCDAPDCSTQGCNGGGL